MNCNDQDFRGLDDATRLALSRRTFLRNSAGGIGLAALGAFLSPAAFASKPEAAGFPNFKPKAKRIIYLFQSGAPSQMDLFDPKPGMAKFRGQDLPASIRQGQRLTTMTSGQKSFPVAPSVFKFAQHGGSGMWFSDAMPHMASKADEWCMVHDPAVTFFGTGHQQPGRPTMGAWASYGLGSENSDLPAYICLNSGGGGQPLQSRYWGPGFLPAQHGAVTFRSAGDAVLYLSNPPGISNAARRSTIDAMNELNRLQLGALGDPAIAAHIEIVRAGLPHADDRLRGI